MNRYVIIGNSGSGKSTLAARLARSYSLPHLDLDTLAWEPTKPPRRRALADSCREISTFTYASDRWVIEGCYAVLVAAALTRCTRLVFLDPGVEACVANAHARPWEPHKYASKAEQDANLEMLIGWIREYPTRSDELSLAAHRAVVAAFAGDKTELGSPDAIAAFGDLPAPVASIAVGRRVSVAWVNELGGTTFEIGSGRDRCFVKWSPTSSPVDLDRERERLEWAFRYAAVPEVMEHGRSQRGAWLATKGLPGASAVDDRWKAAPDVAVAAIGAGLRRLHDALPVAECPFTWSVDERIADIRERSALGAIQPAQPVAVDVGRALAILERAPAIERLVVCHGDACAPNTLIGDDGRCCAHVDLGALGVADRWADLAIATWSTAWNYGPGWEDALLDAYGVERDDERIQYYRLLWTFGP